MQKKEVQEYSKSCILMQRLSAKVISRKSIELNIPLKTLKSSTHCQDLGSKKLKSLQD